MSFVGGLGRNGGLRVMPQASDASAIQHSGSRSSTDSRLTSAVQMRSPPTRRGRSFSFDSSTSESSLGRRSLGSFSLGPFPGQRNARRGSSDLQAPPLRQRLTTRATIEPGDSSDGECFTDDDLDNEDTSSQSSYATTASHSSSDSDRSIEDGDLDLDLDLPESDQSGRGHAGATYQASDVDVPTLLSHWKRLQSGMYAGYRSSLGEGPELVDESNLSQLPDDAEETVEINEKTVAAFFEANNADLVKHYTEKLVPDPKQRALLVQGYMSARSADKLADLKPTKDELEGLLGYVARAATAYKEADFDKQITASIKEWCGSFQQRANLSRVILQAETLLGDPDGTGIALKSLSSYEGDGVMAATRPEERASIRSEVENMLANAAKSRNPNAERALAVFQKHYYSTDRAMCLAQLQEDIGAVVDNLGLLPEAGTELMDKIMSSISAPPEADGGGTPTDQLAMLEQIIQKLPDSGLNLTKAAASIETREDFRRILRSALDKIPQGSALDKIPQGISDTLDGDETASVQSGDASSIASATSTTQGTLTEAQKQTSVDAKKTPAPGPTVQQANTQAPAADPPASKEVNYRAQYWDYWTGDIETKPFIFRWVFYLLGALASIAGVLRNVGHGIMK